MSAQNGPAIVATKTSTRSATPAESGIWLVAVQPWEARVGGDLLFACDYDEAGANSRVRREALAAWAVPFGNGFGIDCREQTADALNIYQTIREDQATTTREGRDRTSAGEH